MKAHRYTALLLALALLTAAFAGCSSKEPPGPTTAPPTSSAPDTTSGTQTPTLPTTEDTTVPAENPGLEYEAGFYDEAFGDDGQDLVRLSVEGKPQLEGITAVNDYYSTVDGSLREYAMLLEAQARDQLEQAQKSGGVFLPYSLDMSYTAMRNDGAIFSVLRQLTEYTGGAHEGMTIYAENFLVPGGERLVLDDLFAVEREVYYPRIQSAVQAAIDAAGNAGDYYPDYQERMMEIFQPEDFCLTDDGVMFFWQVYKIASYVGGVQTFEIPYGDLADILDTQWIP